VTAEVRLEQSGSVGWIVFDHPQRHNAVTGPMLDQLLGLLDRVAQEDTIRVVALRGAGDAAFVSGADISAFGSANGVDQGPRPEHFVGVLSEMAKPVLAVMRGWCLGAGVLLALAADLRIAGDDLRIGIPAGRLGVAYPRLGIDRIVTLAGPAVAAELLMTADRFGADWAVRTGLVNRVVPAGELFGAAQDLAETMAANAPLTMTASKRTITSVLTPADVRSKEQADAAIAACYASADFREGQDAFVGKRPPRFLGR
jgi:enoyl-CoA hydratase/carnithine racemase